MTIFELGAYYCALSMYNSTRTIMGSATMTAGCLMLSLGILLTTEATGQATTRKMSTIINHPSLNVYAPYISADANAIVFVSDNAEDNVLTPFFSFRVKADWSPPQVLPRNVSTRLNFLRGYGLSADGETLFYSTTKSPGVGGFDIWISEWRGAWMNPSNPGAPINSRQHEACASLSTDGKTLYFMRCEKMDQMKAERCSIFRSQKTPTGQWGEPEALPDFINTGNSQTPRIMADGETLIFSSDKMGGQGGMDLFLTRFVNGTWTNPVALNFVNTAQDDQYVSVSALGRYLLRDSPGERKSEIIEYLIPDELRPRGMTKIDGRVAGPDDKPVPAYLSLIDLGSGQRVYNGRPDSDGTFLIYAKEGSRYELSIDPEFGDKTFYSEVLDLTQDPLPQMQRVRAVLKTPAPGDEIELQGISFVEYSSQIDAGKSERELRRLTRLITSNPSRMFEIGVTLEGYREDSLQSHPDLTETMIDTVYWKYIDIDTLGQLYERDTASVKVIYHNDRATQQAQALVAYLVAKGADPTKVAGSAVAIPAVLPGNKKTAIRARVVDR